MNESKKISESKKIRPNHEKNQENPLLNIGFNIIIPIIILNKGDVWFSKWLSPYFQNISVAILIIAISFPIIYFFYDLITRKKYNFISILGLVSVLLTGGIGILQIPTEWFAIKEAAIPALIGLMVIISMKTPFPLIKTFLLNPDLINTEKIESALKENNKENEFDRLVSKCTYLLGFSFLISSLLNYTLARIIVVSPSGTQAYNDEVSNMMIWSWPIIAIPCFLITAYTLWMLLNGIQKLTNYKLEEILRNQ